MKNVSNYPKTNRKKMKVKDLSKECVTDGKVQKRERICLKCEEQFPSKGPYNRICDKCSSTNERVASSTYAVRKNAPSEPNSLEKRFYGQN